MKRGTGGGGGDCVVLTLLGPLIASFLTGEFSNLMAISF
jgi:hypothetical protein